MSPQFGKACNILSSTTSRMMNWVMSDRFFMGQYDTSSSAVFSRLSIKSDEMHGLSKFISNSRKCESREEEEELINEELAKIRCCFGKKSLDGYTKRKCVCKLLFVFLMGRNVDFGHLEALSLLSSNVYHEKQMGYLFISILFDTTRETVHLLIRCIKFDLESDDWRSVDLAIKCIANIGNKDMAQEFSTKLLEIIESVNYPDTIIQSAILCYLKLYRVDCTAIQMPDVCRIVNFFSHRDLGVVYCAATLVDALIKGGDLNGENEIMRIVVTELWRILSLSRIGLKSDQEFNCAIPAPWLLVNLLKVLQNFKIPKEPAVVKMLHNVLNAILIRAQEPHITYKEQKGRYAFRQSFISAIFIKYAVFFEAVNVIIQNTDDSELQSRYMKMLDNILSMNTVNLRYMALESMSRLASSGFRESMKCYSDKVFQFLRNDVDESIRYKALNFLCSICDASNVDHIVGKLFKCLFRANNVIKEAIGYKIYNLADRLFVDYFWYVDTLLKLIGLEGDNDDRIYNKVIKIVISQPCIREHATCTVFRYLIDTTPSDTMVRLAGFLLGEFGHLISASTSEQWNALQERFASSNNYTKCILLSTFMKIAYKFPQMREDAVNIFRKYTANIDVEVQNRSAEYLKFLEVGNFDLLNKVFQEIQLLEGTAVQLPTNWRFKEPFCSLKMLGSDSGDAPISKEEASCQNDVILHPIRNYFELLNDRQLKITAKTEYKGNSGEMILSYFNKTQTEFPVTVQLVECDPGLEVSLTSLHTTLKPGIAVTRTICIECFGIFHDQPTLNVSIPYKKETEFNLHENHNNLHIKLPIYINNFFKPAKLSEAEFYEKWNALDGIVSGCRQKIIKPRSPMFLVDVDRTMWKLRRFNVHLLNHEQSTDNCIMGAVYFVTSSTTTGCLFLIECDNSKIQFRLTIKSPDPQLSDETMKTVLTIL